MEGMGGRDHGRKDEDRRREMSGLARPINMASASIAAVAGTLWESPVSFLDLKESGKSDRYLK